MIIIVNQSILLLTILLSDELLCTRLLGHHSVVLGISIIIVLSLSSAVSVVYTWQILNNTGPL